MSGHLKKDRAIFTLTIFVGSFLLFLVQPMIARMALPQLGGAPNVWNSAMLVYQALLLAGYAYAHAISRLPVLRQGAIHLAVLVLAALTLPLGLAQIPPSRPGWEALWVPWLFVLTVGPLFFAVSAQAPLVQRWFSSRPDAGNPYPLYAASNLGSFSGLLAYPLLAEPLLPISQQSKLWSVGYLILIGMVAVVLVRRRHDRSNESPASATASADEVAPSWRTIALWVALSAVPSGLMLSTTTFLTTDIMAMPLLWVIPLGLYLLSFVIAFAERRGAAHLFVLATPPVLALGGTLAMIGANRQGLLGAAASLVLLFVVATALHAKLYSSRPSPARLTQFYLAMSVGGALGGLFTALVAPLIFDWTWEHPLLLVAAAALIPLGWWKSVLTRFVSTVAIARIALVALITLGLLFRGATSDGRYWTLSDIAVFVPLLTVAVLLLASRRSTFVLACGLLTAGLMANNVKLTFDGARSRSYFGIYTVQDLAGRERRLTHGTTFHGVQLLGDRSEARPTMYYGPSSGIGQALTATRQLYGPVANVGIVGLGVGTLACYRQPGQQYTFFEIDQTVADFSDRGVFTFVNRCAGEAPIVIGDARLKLAEGDKARFDVLAIDAFSSDAIPLHLLTREAFEIYFDALVPNGLLLVHISNRYIDLEPVLAAYAADRNVSSALRVDSPRGEALTRSYWVAMSRDQASLRALTERGGWRALQAPASRMWTDDYASILPFVKWGDLR